MSATEAPTDAQLAFIKTLADERGYPQPAVYSKQHASILIGELQARTYRPPEWADKTEVPFR